MWKGHSTVGESGRDRSLRRLDILLVGAQGRGVERAARARSRLLLVPSWRIADRDRGEQAAGGAHGRRDEHSLREAVAERRLVERVGRGDPRGRGDDGDGDESADARDGVVDAAETPACASPPALSTVDVSGATVSDSPSAKTTTPGNTVAA